MVFVFARTKFFDGAWVVLVIIPLIVMMLSAIHRHYRHLADKLSLYNYSETPPITRHRVIVLMSSVHRGSLAALSYARNLSEDVTVLHVSVDPDETERMRERWETWGNNVRLVILDSPFRLMFQPVLQYIDDIVRVRQPNELITVVVPYFVPEHAAANLLHMQTAATLRKLLSHTKNIVITEVPYQVD